MISSEVQRTLVKSPPELWAEISDPEALARHLGEFGEIRITRVQPEQKVEWEAGDARGAVIIKPSGWGTKVKLTVTRDVALDDRRSADPPDDVVDKIGTEPVAEADRVVETPPEPAEPKPAEPEPFAQAEPEAVAAQDPTEPALAEPEPDPEPGAAHELEPEPRRGFFARLFGRRRTPAAQATGLVGAALQPKTEAQPAPMMSMTAIAVDDEAPVDDEPNTVAEAEAEPTADAAVAVTAEVDDDVADGPETSTTGDERGDAPGARDLATELKAAEEATAEEVTAVLTSVLDRLGAAHHRPFSRP